MQKLSFAKCSPYTFAMGKSFFFNVTCFYTNTILLSFYMLKYEQLMFWSKQNFIGGVTSTFRTRDILNFRLFAAFFFSYHTNNQLIRRVSVCMELSSKLELIYILYNWFWRWIFILIYRGNTVDHSGIVIIVWRLVYRP